MKDWRQLVQNFCDVATNDQAGITDMLDNLDCYIVGTINGAMQARTQEGVDLVLEELEIANEGWRRLE